MQSLGPHVIMHVSDNGDEHEIHVTVYFTGQQTHDLGEGVEHVEEAGEVYLEFEDGESRFPVSGENTLALVGNAIVLTEAHIKGICLRVGGTVYRHIAGDVQKPGDMFLWRRQTCHSALPLPRARQAATPAARAVLEQRAIDINRS